FRTIFQKLDLTKENYYDIKFYALNYIDFNLSLSTRAKFLEKRLPIEKIFTGMSVHFYLPTLYLRSKAATRIGPGKLNTSSGFYDSYDIRMRGDLIAATNGSLTNSYQTSFDLVSSNFDSDSVQHDSLKYLVEVLNYSNTVAFGLGVDLGFILQFNRFIKLGFAATDVGFMVFPSAGKVNFDVDFELETSNAFNFFDQFISNLRNDLYNEEITRGNIEWIMAPTAFRLGVAVTPFKKNIFTWSTDISISDMNNISLIGYPTFNVSTGIEILPGYNWFAIPLRAAFSYNTQANFPSFSFGIGLYLGPVEMDIGVKGLEALISNFGAKEVCVGADLKFVF
ncbi:MAG: hypothetical protein JXB50_06855, partial [Spirochaetes bacterium]|nr:hypothetical protein [Spirochaetota bacterium]